MMAEQPKATGGQPIRYWSFKYPSRSSTEHHRPRRHRKETCLQFHGPPEPWAEAKPFVIWSMSGSSRPSRTRDGRNPKRVSYLCRTLPDELEDVQAVCAT